ncbi:MAG: helix-turn-helix domain-containing protein [Proteobacteria bacterium]|nr:helix-turn-helix domain-containing protein [Pseudomonadota bacterium]
MDRAELKRPTLAQLIDLRRVQLGFTNAQVAERAGITAARLSEIKRQQWAGRDVLLRLAEALEVPLDYFFAGAVQISSRTDPGDQTAGGTR